MGSPLGPLTLRTLNVKVVDGIAYAGEPTAELAVRDVRILDDGILLLTFSTGEMRLFDTTTLLRYPAFKTLAEDSVSQSVKVEYGTLTWDNGNLDYATEALYRESLPYISPHVLVISDSFITLFRNIW